MFGIGGFELFIILVFGFLIFGPDKLPDIARTVGKGIARFREAQQEVNDTIGAEKIFDPDNPDEPFKDPTVVLDKLAQKQEERKAAKEKTEADKPASSSSASASKGDDSKQETFTERKARYERERAARKAAEAAGEADADSKAEATADSESKTETAPTTSESGADSAAPEASSTEGGDE